MTNFMTKPCAVVFDLGTVLVNFDYGITVRALLARCTVPATELVRIIDQSSLLFRYETGDLTTEAFYSEVKAASGFRGDLEEFCLHFGDIFSPIEPMIELHASLRARGVPTFIFSNTNELAVRHIRAHFPFFANFDGYVFSHEIGRAHV